MLEAITARPVTPIWAVAEVSDELTGGLSLFGCGTGSLTLSGEEPLQLGEPRQRECDGRRDDHRCGSQVCGDGERHAVGPAAEPAHADDGGGAAGGQRAG